MATEIVSEEIPQVLPPELHPCVDHLVTEDDTPVDNIFSEKQQRLLTEPLFSSWKQQGGERKFVALANVGLFYAIKQPPYVPDMLLSMDVELPENVHPKRFRSYFVWEYGKRPDVVIEVVSNKEGGEDTDKFAGYARIGIPYYVIHDPEQLLSEHVLQAFCLQGMKYVRLDEPIWLSGIDLGLRLWLGPYEGLDETWLRWCDEHGQPILTGAERAEQEHQRAEHEHQRAEHEHQRAEHERQRAERLAAQLRKLGADPDV